MCQQSHRLEVNASFKVDPTRTKTLRAKYIADTNRRFRELKKAIVITVWRNDALGLGKTPKINVGARRFVGNIRPAGPGQFDFPRSKDKANAFIEWMREAQKQSILEITRGSARVINGSGLWADIYLQSAYQKGVAQAAAQMRKAGEEIAETFVDSAFFRPVHADRAGLIYTRNYESLSGITAQMDAQISSVLAEGIIEGLNPKQIARNIVDRVDAIGRTRANMIARTEVIAAHAEAALNSYEEMGLDEVTADVEFATAADGAVCPKCAALEGAVYTLAQARGVIPVHPNCRCSWIPVVR